MTKLALSKEHKAWTFCKDCVFWRVFDGGSSRLALLADYTPTEVDYPQPGCFRHASDIRTPWESCSGDNGCGEGVRRIG